MATVSSWDFWWPMAVIGGLAILIFGGWRARTFLVVAGISIGVTDGLVVDSMKNLIGRPRPHEVLEGVRVLDLANAKPRILAVGMPLKEHYSEARVHPQDGNSFPSGHAANNFALATVVTVYFRRWGWLAFLPASLVSYSRIYVGSHWPLDVVVSCLIGAGISLIVMALLEWSWKTCGSKFLPRVWNRHPRLI